MLNLLLALLKSDGVNEFGDLATVLKGFYNPLSSIKPSTPHNEIIGDVVETTKRPVCLILIDKNEHNNINEHFELYFLTNETEWNTIYLVCIFGEYAMINKPNTPKQLIKKFEQIKNENTYANQDIQAVESELSDLMELDYKKDFVTLDAFKKSYQLKPSPSRKIRFENNSPKSTKGILKKRKTNRSASAPAPTPITSPINNSPPPITSPINNSPPRTNKPTYMGWLFPKNPKKKTVRNLGPGPAMRELIRRTHKGWEKEKINP